MQRKCLKCVCTCACMSLHFEESIMNKRTEATPESTLNCLYSRVLLCAHWKRQDILSANVLFLCECVWVYVRVAVIHWPDSSSWGSAHIPVITAVPTADWLLSARSGDVSHSQCWFPAKVNTLERCWQYRLAIDELWHMFHHQCLTPQ